VCNGRGGGGDQVVWRAYTGVIQSVFQLFDQIPSLQNFFTTPNKNLGGEGASDFRQINTCGKFLYRPI
jgi:hypothetical protein